MNLLHCRLHITMKTMTILPLLFYTLLHVNVHSAYTDRHDVQMYPFFALANMKKQLHIVDDQFDLVQHIDMKVIITHLQEISVAFIKIKQKYNNFNSTLEQDVLDSEKKLTSMLQHLGQYIESGLLLLPHKHVCLRVKRATAPMIDEEVVNTHPLFPAVGKLFQWVTGSLSNQAGKYINQNFNNIRRLTQLSAKFSDMFNATLQIQRKHKEQILNIRNQVRELEQSVLENLNLVNLKLHYLNFVNNLNFVVLDMTNTVNLIFETTDNAEANQLGPLTRDPTFLQSVSQLMGSELRAKFNSLYLMKLAAKVDIEVCHSSISVVYKFPYLRRTNFKPKKVIPIPKLIRSKYFSLEHYPQMIAFSDRVLLFSKMEFDNCNFYNKHIFCNPPSHSQGLLKNCIYSIINNLAWKDLSEICPLTLNVNPEEMVELWWNHLIYFNYKEKYLTTICPKFDGGSKTITISGAGIITIPNNCQVKTGGFHAHVRGHASRSADISFQINDSSYN